MSSVIRPLLIPGLPRVWRSASELQLGTDPSRAVSVRLPDPRAAQVLDLLDGVRSERAVLARVVELGVPADQARAVIATLRSAGLIRSATELVPAGLPPETRRRLTGEASALALIGAPGDPAPAEVLRRRWHSRVVITGHGRLGAPIAVALAEAGVGQVQADLTGVVGPGELAGGPLRGSDLGRLRRDAISDAILRAAPGLRPFPVRKASARASSVRRPAPSDPHPHFAGPAGAPGAHAHPASPAGVPQAHPHFAGPAAPHHDAHSDPASPAGVPGAHVSRPASHPDAAEAGAPTSPGLDAAARDGGAIEAGSHGVREMPVTLVVQLDHNRPPAGVPHLAVTIREGTPVIGPFVPVGGSPCLRCLDLHRHDRDATWPGLPRRPPVDPVQPCTVATVLAATAFATAEALTHLDGGRPQTLGTAIEITAPGRIRRRRWPAHPACTCAAGPRRARSRHQ